MNKKISNKTLMFILTMLGGITGMVFYSNVVKFLFTGLRNSLVNPWIFGFTLFLIGLLLFSLSMVSINLQYKYLASHQGLSLGSGITFYFCGIGTVYGGSFLLVSLLGMVLQFLGAA